MPSINMRMRLGKLGVRVVATAGSIEGFCSLFKQLQKMIVPGMYSVKIIWRNLPCDLQRHQQIYASICDCFGDEAEQKKIIADIVLNHIIDHGKNPDITNTEKMYNYIRTVSNRPDLIEKDLEEIRCRLLYPIKR